jgi:hypothetical protein
MANGPTTAYASLSQTFRPPSGSLCDPLQTLGPGTVISCLGRRTAEQMNPFLVEQGISGAVLLGEPSLPYPGYCFQLSRGDSCSSDGVGLIAVRFAA